MIDLELHVHKWHILVWPVDESVVCLEFTFLQKWFLFHPFLKSFWMTVHLQWFCIVSLSGFYSRITSAKNEKLMHYLLQSFIFIHDLKYTRLFDEFLFYDLYEIVVFCFQNCSDNSENFFCKFSAWLSSSALLVIRKSVCQHYA